MARSETFNAGNPEFSKYVVESQQTLRDLRWKIGATWFLLALLLTVAIEVANESVHGSAMRPIRNDLPGSTLGGLGLETLFNARFLLLSEAPLADDGTTTRIVIALDILTVLVVRVADFKLLGIEYMRKMGPFWVSAYLRGFIFVACACWAACSAKPRKMQLRMWLSISIFTILNIAEKLAICGYKFILYHHLPHVWAQLIPDVALLCVTLSPRLRGGLQRRLWTFLERRALYQGAASLACLIGKCSPSEVVAQANTRFKSIDLKCISLEVMATNRPSPAVSALSDPCALGNCDAFISHSWHDDSLAKWEALQSWRTSFLEEHKREPRVWFDKCCLDQNNIEIDLRCLPVFLKGCSQMVVLCGPSFLSRLWCILELFTFIHLGGKVEDIDFVPVIREGYEEEDVANINKAFDTFDARECQCADEEDRERILTIIETAYGSVHGFNRIVQSIMVNDVQPRISMQNPCLAMPTLTESAPPPS